MLAIFAIKKVGVSRIYTVEIIRNLNVLLIDIGGCLKSKNFN